MARFFNTAGPVNCQKHYCLPPLSRFDLEQILELIDHEKYFVLHAPRQTGKTSCLLALMDHLNVSGRYCCLYVNVEVGQAAREDVAEAMRAILSKLALQARHILNDTFLDETWQSVLAVSGAYAALGEVLALWAKQSAHPTVLLIDEIDALVGDTLIAALRQLREGYPQRPSLFPQSVILCGVRDPSTSSGQVVRDYRIHSAQDKAIITGGSAFNIKAESLRLGNFTQADTVALYAQHTAETGQPFEPAALELAWQLTQGQPWLVNALGYEVCFRMAAERDGWGKIDHSTSISAEMMIEAKERLIERRETHLDQLVDKLKEDRVRRVILPLLSGDLSPDQIPTDDILYVRDLGLIETAGQLHIANPIYQEIIPRELTFSTQLTIAQEPAWYVQPDGRLDMPRLLAAFQQFFREHSEHWVERFDYKEAGPQLLLQAFLQRIVNGGGRVEREYGLGRMRTDLLVVWPIQGNKEEGGGGGGNKEHRPTPYSLFPTPSTQRIVLELKVVYKSLEQTIEQGLEQTWQYMDRCGADEGHLVIFDRDPAKAWDDKIFCRPARRQDTPITVWGM